MMTFLFLWLLSTTPQKTTLNRFDAASAPTMQLVHWKIKEGDQLQWASPELDDSQWDDLNVFQTGGQGVQTGGQGNWWLRTRVEIDERLASEMLFSICPEGLASAVEIYWDGMRIYQNGRIGARAIHEQVGAYYSPTHINPNLITPGQHTIAIRISNHHAQSFLYEPLILFGSYEALLKGISIWQIKIYFAVGILFITLVLNGFLFFASGRQPRYLLFFIFCALVAARLLVNSLWVFDALETTYYDFQLQWIAIAEALVGIALPVFLIYHFGFPHKWATPLIVLTNITLYIISWPNVYLAFLCFSAGGVLIWAIFKGRDGAMSIMACLIPGFLGLGWEFRNVIDPLTWLSLFLILAFNYHLSRHFTRQARLAEEARLRSVRLENELLKRNISPHFLMNALTSVIVWMRRDPDTAIELVEALADEFRMVSTISNRKTIPLQQELQLCQAHLRVMSIRKGANFELEADTVSITDEIPPMILHTLLENGLTHGYEKRREGRFRFTRKLVPGSVEYSLFNDGSSTSGTSGSGTGLKYVKARLTESFGDQWELHSRGVEGGWLTVIRIPLPTPSPFGKFQQAEAN